MYADNDILFPPHVIPLLRNSGGDDWKNLVDRVSRLPEDDPESLAFSLMMVRIDGCMDCETDSYRAMRGCLACAQQMLRRGKESDSKLLARYTEAREDIELYLLANPWELEQEKGRAAKAA